MIGILCSDTKEKKYAERLHAIYKHAGHEKDNPIVVFTISNINFKDKTIKGSLISAEEIKLVRAELPAVIINISTQREKGNIKRLRYLCGMSDVKIVNETNRFDQWMIMEMLTSSEQTAGYVLSHFIYDKKNRNYKPDDNEDYIVMPSRGSSISRVIFTQPDPETGQIGGSQYFKKGHICDYIDASLCQKRWIFLKAPDILVQHNLPVVIRAYVQKGRSGEWDVLGAGIYPGTRDRRDDIVKNVYEAAAAIIDCISKFMPGPGICYIDFVVDSKGNPYFLHFGGFDHRYILYQNRSREFCERFYKNLMYLASFYDGMNKGA